MPAIHVHDIELVRVTDPPAVHVYDMELVSVPVVDPPKVQISDMFLTSGFEAPVTTGAVRVRSGGTWISHNVKVRWNGAWA